MADADKSSKPDEDSVDSAKDDIVDAEIVETPDDGAEPAEPEVGVSEQADDTPDDALTADSDSDVANNAPDADPELTQTEVDHPLDSVEDGPSEAEAAVSPPEPQPVYVRKGGFWPMVLGGVVAAGVGFGAAKVLFPGDWPFKGDDSFETDTTAALQDQSKQISALGSDLQALRTASDLTPVHDALGQMKQDASQAIAGLDERLSGLDSALEQLETRFTELEKRPVEQGVSQAAIAAYERELKALQDAMAAQRAEIESIASDAAAMEENAQETARETMARAALTRILSALDSGTAFGGALADLEGATGEAAPGALKAVSDGVDTLSVLQETFPDVARAALRAARSSDADEAQGVDRVASFLRNQLSVRSVAPKEGDDPDAVLSRVEASVQSGRLGDALAEIETLPEMARAELTDWTGRAQARQDALAAIETLAQSLNQQ